MSPARSSAAALAATLSLLGAASATAATYYVSPTGSDRASGSEASPFLTIKKAVDTVRANDVILVAPGSYPSFQDTRIHGNETTGSVRITALDPSRPPVLRGMAVLGGGYLAVDRVKFDGPILLAGHPMDHTRFARNVTIADSEITNASGGTCVTIRNGTYSATLANNRIHGCYTGILGPGDGIADLTKRPRAQNVQILGNTIEQIKSDAMQIANWDDSTIDGNTIRDIRDPAGVIHNDAIQIMGNSHRLRITNNTLRNSSQLLFSQDAMGPNDGLYVAGNLMLDGGAYSVMLAGTRNIEFVNNTVWRSRWGVIFRTRASGVWAHNIIDRFVPGEGTGPMSDQGFNLTYKRTAGTPALTDLVGVDPQFVDPAGDDFRLLPTSPALRLRAGVFLQPLARRGLPRAPVRRPAGQRYRLDPLIGGKVISVRR